MKIAVTQDAETAKKVRQALFENDGYCPCKLQHLPENLCICQDFLDAAAGTYCKCGLYYKQEA